MTKANLLHTLIISKEGIINRKVQECECCCSGLLFKAMSWKTLKSLIVLAIFKDHHGYYYL